MMRRVSGLLGHPIPQTNMQRHLLHYKVVETGPPLIPDPSKKYMDLEILDLVIQRGAANSQNWKPSIKDTIEAMKLKMQMTGNSAFDDLITLFDGAPDPVDEAMESPEALLSPEERPDESDDELEGVL
jgi:hypothetical protein